MSCLNILFCPEGQPDLTVWDRSGLDLFWSYHHFACCAFQNTSLILALAERTLDLAARGRQLCPSPCLFLTDRTPILFRMAKDQAKNSISQTPLVRRWPSVFQKSMGWGFWENSSVPGKEAMVLVSFAFVLVQPAMQTALAIFQGCRSLVLDVIVMMPPCLWLALCSLVAQKD